jgi:hypothetical protein
MEQKKCLRCGGERLEPGAIQSTGRIYFRPSNSSFWTFQTADVEVQANLCLGCGTIELVGDVKKAESLVGRAKPH